MYNNTTLFVFKITKKCIFCKKRKTKILGTQIVDDDIHITSFCVKCFKKETPDYTLAMKCIKCTDNFKCNIQKIIFSRKEIKQFKKELNNYPKIVV